MSGWSELPAELLQEIASRLDSSLDPTRFRSVCCAWRRAINPRRLPNPFSILPAEGFTFANSFGSFSLSKRSIFLLSLPPNDSHSDTPSVPNHLDPNFSPWMIKTEEVRPGVFHLFSPLSRTRIKPFLPNFPPVIDLWNIRVQDLGQEYVLRYTNDTLGLDHSSFYMEKVAFLVNNEKDYALLTIHISGRLAMFRSVDNKWTVINEMYCPFDDVILFKGKFYAVDSEGRAVGMGVDCLDSLTLVAKPFFGGDRKCFVRSGDDLLLVDLYYGVPSDSDHDDGDEEGPMELYHDQYLKKRRLYFEVFKLDWDGQKWVQVMSLDDRSVLFLSDNCAFRASVYDLRLSESHADHICYHFMDSGITVDDSPWFPDVQVVDLANSKHQYFENFDCSNQMFAPVPAWIAKELKKENADA